MSGGGKSVRLFLVDGTPGGLTTAEIMNWTGHVIAAPRSDLAVLLARPEVARTGIYLLIGDDPDSPGNPLAYVGEGDDVGKRLVSHARSEDKGGKDFWNRAVVLTSKDQNLTKAHARYLEPRLITLAAEARRGRLTNGTAPPPIVLPEADQSDMEYFIEQAKIVLPVLGVNLFRSTKVAPPPVAPRAVVDVAIGPTVSPVFELKLRKDGIVAEGQEVDGEFVVRSGSLARRKWTSAGHNYEKLHRQAIADGVLIPDAVTGLLRFSRDQVFASPSAAAAVVLGRPANGRNDWKTRGAGLSYGTWQERLLDQAAGGET